MAILPFRRMPVAPWRLRAPAYGDLAVKTRSGTARPDALWACRLQVIHIDPRPRGGTVDTADLKSASGTIRSAGSKSGRGHGPAPLICSNGKESAVQHSGRRLGRLRNPSRAKSTLEREAGGICSGAGCAPSSARRQRPGSGVGRLARYPRGNRSRCPGTPR